MVRPCHSMLQVAPANPEKFDPPPVEEEDDDELAAENGEVRVAPYWCLSVLDARMAR